MKAKLTPEDIQGWTWVETSLTTIDATYEGYIFRTEYHSFRNMYSYTFWKEDAGQVARGRPKDLSLSLKDLWKKTAKEALERSTQSVFASAIPIQKPREVGAIRSG